MLAEPLLAEPLLAELFLDVWESIIVWRKSTRLPLPSFSRDSFIFVKDLVKKFTASREKAVRFNAFRSGAITGKVTEKEINCEEIAMSLEENIILSYICFLQEYEGSYE